MNTARLSVIALVLGFLALGALPCAAYEPAMRRDLTYERNLKYMASADTAITPARVLRWMLSLRDNSAVQPEPSNFEFQPIFRAKDSRHQFIAQFAYKF